MSINIKEYKKDLIDFLDRFNTPELAQFLRDVLLDHYKPEDEETLNKYKNNLYMAKYLLYYLHARKMYNPIVPNKQTDTAAAAILIHNLFFDGDKDNWKTVFEAREKLDPIAMPLKNSGNWEMFDYIWQIVEAQLGEDMPIPACRPVIGQITYIVWEIIWIFNHDINNSKEAVEKLFDRKE